MVLTSVRNMLDVLSVNISGLALDCSCRQPREVRMFGVHESLLSLDVNLELLVGPALVLVQFSRDEAQDILLQLRVLAERGQTVLDDIIQQFSNVSHTGHYRALVLLQQDLHNLIKGLLRNEQCCPKSMQMGNG